jgi:putative hydroxymethylpyrimidine transport system permease protein
LPVVILSQALPTLVIAPLFVLWFGLTLNAKVLLVIFALFFPISLSLYEGVRLMPEVWHDQAYLMRATRWQKFWRLEVRWAMPAWRSGIKMATAWAPVSAVASEWVGSSKGLGFLMINANSQLNTPLLFESIVVLVAMAWILYGSVGWIVDRLMV